MNSPQARHSTHYSCLIIGGGIVGAGLFRDLALHDVDCLLVDQGDFSSQTSSRSSKMLHGGIRYLENLDFKLVHEALKEKNLWKKKFPEHCKELSFYLPVYQTSKYPLFMTRMALILYDLLSSFQNKPHQVLSKNQTLQKLPFLRAQGLKGSGMYHDVVIDDLKLTLEMILDAKAKNPQVTALNYKKVSSLTYEHGLFEIELTDTLQHFKTQVTSDFVIFATGPFTDRVMSDLKVPHWKNILALSQGSHLWLKQEGLSPETLQSAVVLQTKDNRVLFVIPHEGKILAGTTETPLKDDLFNIKADLDDQEYILEQMNHYFSVKLKKSDVIDSFSGVRPLVKESGIGLGKLSREHKVFRPFDKAYALVGGKYTTFRVMAQDVVRPLLHQMNKSYNPSLTLTSPMTQRTYIGKKLPTQFELQSILKEQTPRTLEDLTLRRIASCGVWDFEMSQDDFIKNNQDLLSFLGEK